MNCDYCHSAFYDSPARPGTCNNCGAPNLIAIEEKKEFLSMDVYGYYEVINQAGYFIRMANNEDIKTLPLDKITNNQKDKLIRSMVQE